MSMKMDTVWQAKVADSAIKSELVTHLDVAGAEINLALGLGLWILRGPNWIGLRSLGLGLGLLHLEAQTSFVDRVDRVSPLFLIPFFFSSFPCTISSISHFHSSSFAQIFFVLHRTGRPRGSTAESSPVAAMIAARVFTGRTGQMGSI